MSRWEISLGGKIFITHLYTLGFELWESIINLKIRLKKLKIASENRDIFVVVTGEKFVRGCKEKKLEMS